MKGHEVAALEDLVERDEAARSAPRAGGDFVLRRGRRAARARRVAQKRRLYVERTEQALDAPADVADADDAELPARDVGHARQWRAANHCTTESAFDPGADAQRIPAPSSQRGVEVIDADGRGRHEAHAAALEQRRVHPYCRSYKK